MTWELSSTTRISYNAITYYATIDTVDNKKYGFFWQIFIVPINLLDNLIPLRQLTLASSNYTYSLREAKQTVQEKILEYKISGVGEIKSK